jgi:hypothetical protein
MNELGWDNDNGNLHVIVKDKSYSFTSVAQKRGFKVYHYHCPQGEVFPDYSTRRSIDNEVTKNVREHIIIYTDTKNTHQIWQWVKRQPNGPSASREYHYYIHQSGELLYQKLMGIYIPLENEEELTLPGMIFQLQAAFDVERVTRRFYTQFKSEHDKFMKFIKGIPDDEFRRWYASIMINRLMFVYFIQKKGFLNHDESYLQNKLDEFHKTKKDTFYRGFLCPLFFRGFATPDKQKTKDDKELLGNIPYLNGGIFEEHDIEKRNGKELQIPDRAFQNLFSFFNQYQWHLDDRPLKDDGEINPDVLGYIFEKYINQKQMGAYYTKEDITEYISRNTILPRLLDMAKESYSIAFQPGSFIWSMLKENPDRYIFPSIRHGVTWNYDSQSIEKGNPLEKAYDLPKNIEKGIDTTKPGLIERRKDWNQTAPREYALPTETWREVVARRQRYQEIKDKLQKGEVTSFNDFITYNLDIRQFVQDIIDQCEGPELLRAFWKSLNSLSVLDPTCGSGAFLFAALNILEPLYESCINRMETFITELDESSQKHREDKYKDFKDILNKIHEHPNERYYILKTIILKNLYGVDIMEEAIEICKLRLFLKLAAQVDSVDKLEPLPDIDFNIKAGNTLVGFVNYDDVKKSMEGDWIKLQELEKIKEKAEKVNIAFKEFKDQQLINGGEITHKHKIELQKQLQSLRDVLDHYLAENEYGIKNKNKEAFSKWMLSHLPFHWWVEFYPIIQKGGFDVIIGNPPYVEYSKVKDEYEILNYETINCGNLYAFVVERNNLILKKQAGLSGMIIPHSSICTDRMKPLFDLFLTSSSLWGSTYCIRPSKLFNGVDQRLLIFILNHKGREIFSAKYHHWFDEERCNLLNNLRYIKTNEKINIVSIPKIANNNDKNIFLKTYKHDVLLRYLSGISSLCIYYHNAPRYWIRAMNKPPYFWNEIKGKCVSTQIKKISLKNNEDSNVLVAIINSSLFYWWFVLLSDCRHLNLREIESFPIGLDTMNQESKRKLYKLSESLMEDYESNKVRKECHYKTTGKVKYDEYYPRLSKPIIDEIDKVLAEHYGFTEEELDYIINYDIKYRMGLGNGDEEEE